MRVRDRKSKRVPAKKIVPQYDRDHELEYLSTPPRRPASSPANAKRRLEFETPTAPAPRSEPISPTLLEVIGVEDCTMHCRQCDVDFQTVEGLVDHFTEEHGDDTSYCYTCDETFAKPHLLWPHLYTSPRHENAPPESKFEFSSTAYRWEALMTGQRCSGEAPIDISGANETRKVSHVILTTCSGADTRLLASTATDQPGQIAPRQAQGRESGCVRGFGSGSIFIMNDVHVGPGEQTAKRIKHVTQRVFIKSSSDTSLVRSMPIKYKGICLSKPFNFSTQSDIMLSVSWNGAYS